jgi:hypothetical protein
MIRFKKIDYKVSLVLLILGFSLIILTVLNNIIYAEDVYTTNATTDKSVQLAILTASFFWGVWQVLSMIVHLFFIKNWDFIIARSAYTIVSCIVLYYSFTVDIHYYQHIFLLPYMAIFYTFLCWLEVSKTKEKNEAV